MKRKISQQRDLLFALFFLVAVCLGTAFFVPLQGIGFALPKLVIFACLATVGSLWLLWQEQIPMLDLLRNHRLGQLWGYLMIVVLLSFTWSVMPILSAIGTAPRFGGALTYVICFALAACAINLCQTQETRARLVDALLLSNAIIVGYGFLQLLRLDPLSFLWEAEIFLGRAFSFVGQPNVLAAFILLTMPFAAVRSLDPRRPLPERVQFWLLILLNILTLLGTASRAGLIGLGVQIGVILLFVGPLIRKNIYEAAKKHTVVTTLLVVILVTFASFIFSQRWSAPVETPLRSVESRTLIWQDAIQMILDRPQGYGLDSLGVLSPQYRSVALGNVEPLNATVDRAHSLPLDLWLTLGPLGLLAYYALLVALLGAAWRLRKVSSGATAAGLGMLGYSVAMLFGFESILTQVFFWLMAGLIMGIVWQFEKGKVRATAGSIRFAIIILGILSMATAVTTTQWLRGRTHLARATAWEERGQRDAAFSEFAQAARAFVYDRETIVSLTEYLLRVREASKTNAAAIDDVIEYSIEALDRLTNGQDVTVPLLRGWHAAVQGNVVAMREELADARKRAPNSIDTQRVALHAFRLTGEIAAANQALERLIALLPPVWRQPSSEAGRILWKENPWLFEIRELEVHLNQTK